MRNLLRKPLPWIVICECAIVAALVMVAWHMFASPPPSPVSGVQATAPAAQNNQAASPTPSMAARKAPVHTLLPGLNVDSSFWRARLAALNQGENSFEQLEWRIVHAAMDAARRYVGSVVVPAIARAERGGR